MYWSAGLVNFSVWQSKAHQRHWRCWIRAVCLGAYCIFIAAVYPTVKPHSHPIPKSKNEHTASTATKRATAMLFEANDNSLSMKYDPQKWNVFKWTETHFRAMPLEKGGEGVGPLPFHSTVHQTQAYFVIVFHTYNTRENSLHKIVSALVLFPLSFVYEPFTTV